MENTIIDIDTDKSYSLEEYIALDSKSDTKHEFYYGKLFQMPGAPILHNQICLQLFFILKQQLLGTSFEINVENVKVKIQNEEIYLYPDVVLSTEKATTLDAYIIYNPILLAEVLSSSTRKYDSTDKFIQYSKIDSLKYYLLIEPEKHVVIFYERTPDNDWQSMLYTELNETIHLPALNCSISLGDIYK
jgi:Uma2 family endonuclease